MKIKALLALLFCGNMSYAQNDPTVMTINGEPVSRSEFEYSYNKNNGDNVLDKKSVADYVELFINYKLKVAAAKEARLDTLSSFKNEFAGYRDQQIRPSFITDADVEAEARKIYSETQQRVDAQGGLVKPAHILMLLPQKATKIQEETAARRIDSIYQALKAGADFDALARNLSDDKGSSRNGGELPWIQHGQTLKEFEDVVFSLKKGEMSKPFLSPAGYHIVLLKDKGNFFPYDSVRADIIKFIDQRGLREQLIDKKLADISSHSVTPKTPEQVLDERRMELERQDPNLKNLIREYYDGLLVFEISNKTVWEKAAQDEAGLEAFFKKNKKRYTWEEPRFKGIAYHVKDKKDVKAVKDAVKGLPFSRWTEKLRTTFNNDSVLRIRVEKGIFKKSDNAWVDARIFKKGTIPQPMKDFPISAIYGKKLKAPQEMEDVRALVVTDYQEALEKEWVEQLRKKYVVKVDDAVLKTVNNH